MKKIFTFAAAILASVAMMAVEPTYQSQDWADQASVEAAIGEHDGVTIINSGLSYGNLGSNGKFYYMAAGSNLKASDGTWKYFGVDAGSGYAIDSISIYYCENGGNETNIAWAAWGANETPSATISMYGETAGTTGAKKLDNAKWVNIDLSALEAQTIYLNRSIREFKNAEGGKIDNFGKSQTFNILGFKVWTRVLVIKTDPVTTVTIDGDAAGYVGGSVKLTATTDAKADSLYWTVDGAVQENSNSKTFTLALEAARTYSVVCYARNQYNEADKFAASEVFNVVATEKPVLEQVVVTDDMTWDFSKAASVSDIKWTDADKDAAPVLLANVDGMNNNAEFNSQALLFSGEYPIRDGKYCQGPHLEFKINAPGLMSVEYSNTGNRSAAEGETEGQEALRRFLTVNGNLVPGDAGTMKSNANTTVVDIVVAPGDVVISSVMPYSDKPTDAQYIRIYKVAYQRKGWPTAIENTDAAVKAVKVVRDGQMMILKNGVLYNMQGAVVK